MMTSAEIPLSLYIHIPWCEKKCPYCDFNSHENQQNFDEPAYIKALLDDLDQDLEIFNEISNKPIHSVFIGGGTPSLFSADAYQKLFKEIGHRLDLRGAEITLEANPSSSEQAKFSGYLDAGINRLSIGTQSYNPIMLKRLGRVHNQHDAMTAVKSAKQAGFARINLDIMFALPEQTLAQSIEDIEQAIAFAPEHISCYQLTLEPNTLFFQQKPALPNNELAWTMQQALQQKLFAAGYEQYEVSAYAQKNQQCRHNLNYWQFGDYLGIGAGAHGKITLASGQIKRYWKQKQPKKYLQSASSVDRLGGLSTLANNSIAFEFMLNALRLKKGFSSDLFQARTGLTLASIENTLNKHYSTELLTQLKGRIQPTNKGYQFIDSMLNDYLPES